MSILTRGIRNAFRNTIRTVSIVVIVGLSIALSLSMFVAHQAVGTRIAAVQSSVGNTITISPAGVRGFDGGGNPLTTDEINKVQSDAHVSVVTSTLNDRLTSSDTNLQSAVDLGQLGQRFITRGFNGGGGFSGTFGGGGDTNFSNFTPPVTVIGTTNPTNLAATQGGGTFTLKSGTVINGTSSDKTALVGTTLAAKNNLSVGSTFTAYGQTITVSGIFDSGNSFSNNMVVMPLATVQSLSSQTGDVTSAVVTVDSVTNLDSVASAIRSQLGSAADVTTATDQAQQIIAPLQNVQAISLYSLVGAVAAGTVIILLTMVMIVRERRREIGVLKAIGASNLAVTGQFVSEAVTFTLLGAVVGILGGIAMASPITNLLVTNSNTSITSTAGPVTIGGFGGGGRVFARSIGRNLQAVHAAVGWDVVIYGLGIALFIAIIGSALASYTIAKVRPAEVMRTE